MNEFQGLTYSTTLTVLAIIWLFFVLKMMKTTVVERFFLSDKVLAKRPLFQGRSFPKDSGNEPIITRSIPPATAIITASVSRSVHP